MIITRAMPTPANRRHRRVAPHHRRSGNQNGTMPGPCCQTAPPFLPHIRWSAWRSPSFHRGRTGVRI